MIRIRKLIPNPFDTEGQYQRFNHLDIAGLADDDLIDEVSALRPLLWWKFNADDWLRERIRRLEGELTRRRLMKRQGGRQ